MTYQEAIDKLFALPMFQQVGSKAYIPSLDNIQNLDELLDRPSQHYKTIHIAGTNGKGSTSHLIASVLQEAGYRVGLYTSPHLMDYRERVRINGKMVSEEVVVSFMDRTSDFFASRPVSFFEATTALAFYAFEQSDVDIAIIETGLGGLYDSTNIVNPILSVITNISFDHRAILGNTLQDIAFQKGGIIKKGVPVIVGERQSETDLVFKKLADEHQSSLLFAEDLYHVEQTEAGLFVAETPEGVCSYSCDLQGEYQTKNITTLLAMISKLSNDYSITPDNILRGIGQCATNTGLMGRWQQLSSEPLILCDTGHNEAGVRYITRQLSRQSYKQLYIVLGFMADKELDNILPYFPKDAFYFFSQAVGERAMPAVELQKRALEHDLRGEVIGDIAQTVDVARKKAKKDDVIFIGGSTFVVAEVLDMFLPV